MDKRISNLAQVASVNRMTCRDGKQKGLDLVYIHNGVLDIILNESKALDIAQLKFKGENVSFISKNGLVAQSVPFLNAFNGGMLYTCGLDSVGGRDGYPLHGTFHNIPANITQIVCNEEQISVTAEIIDTALFGQNLIMKRTFTTNIASNKFTLNDELTNCGYNKENYCLLYHINLGYPFLDESCIIKADIKNTIPRTDWAAKHISSCLQMQSPVDGIDEMCYFHELNSPKIEVINQQTKRKLKLNYYGDILKYVVEWKSLASGDYVLGIEPTTTMLDSYFKYNVLLPNQTVKMGFSIEMIG